MYNILFFLIWIIVLGSTILYHLNKRKYAQLPTIPPLKPQHRPIIMIIIDSLMDQPLQKAIRSGQAPALQFLLENGHYSPKMVTSFPTMSVCIDSTLLTGAFPNQHQIFGLSYFHQKRKRMVNFGTGPRESFAFGLKRVFKDSLEHLNQHFLSKEVKTIHEELDEPTASINGLIYRGKTKHILRPPLLATLSGILPFKIPTQGPAIFSYGSLAKIDPDSYYDQLILRCGFNSRFARMELVSLIKNQRLPVFTFAYLSDNDEIVHRKGPSTTKGIRKVDKELAKILDAFPSWEEALKQVTWIIIGDSGQTAMTSDRSQMYVDLRQLLQRYTIMPLKRSQPLPEDQLVLCVNERMAYVYIMDRQITKQELVHTLKQEKRLDIIAWKEDSWIHVESGQQNGRLSYRAGGDHEDIYQQSWTLRGDPALLDIRVSGQKRIEYGDYPDVLARLNGVMEAADDVIVLTVLPGYEMIAESSPKHKGACHGSLHAADSLVPMIVCGPKEKPECLRQIDLKEWILQQIKQA
ncbi:alkaline phosphatase family protein [Thermoflavimicrobium dichotomicum]|uniref:Type I phosphodiesterase / nucleotide pyrophosphatase n=1 Tax=Thermoflavimicrobium dichotomicum TaxID=46223 RepID=A0A1I3L3U3_9BACL|nr:alkaline phosphatase family protein [Thermoflavimicrobium dichotomicum]SFI79286.1 Type I phosphodiesterase / nucleotide pyrophosphatase [Thermoflavimicrobium dichotomicum]